MTKRPYSRMFYPPNDDLAVAIEKGHVAERIVNQMWSDDMTSDEFFEALLVIEMRVIRVFANAKFPDTLQPTDNFVVGARGTIVSLTRYIEARFGYEGYVVYKNDLPRDIRRLKSTFCEEVAKQVRLYLINLVLETFKEEGEIRFDTKRETWEIRQSKVDEYNARRSRAGRSRRRMKFDRRTLHGLPREQAVRRGLSGASIGPVRSKAS